MAEYSVVGKPLPRIDGKIKATGEAKFTDDAMLPGMLYGKILRSPYPHARILNIDTGKAKVLPGVKAVITGEDVGLVRFSFLDTPRYPADQCPLAIDKVRYIGEEVAAIAATTTAPSLAPRARRSRKGRATWGNSAYEITSSSFLASSPISALAFSIPGANMSAGRAVIGSSSPITRSFTSGLIGAGGRP